MVRAPRQLVFSPNLTQLTGRLARRRRRPDGGTSARARRRRLYARVAVADAETTPTGGEGGRTGRTSWSVRTGAPAASALYEFFSYFLTPPPPRFTVCLLLLNTPTADTRRLRLRCVLLYDYYCGYHRIVIIVHTERS